MTRSFDASHTDLSASGAWPLWSWVSDDTRELCPRFDLAQGEFSYVDEFTFRLNVGNVSHHTLERLDSFVVAVVGKHLTYKELTACARACCAPCRR